MDGETHSRRPVLVLVAVAALLVGLAVYGALALFGDDDSDTDARPATTSTAVPSRLPTTLRPSVSTTAPRPATAGPGAPSASTPDSPGSADTPDDPAADDPTADGPAPPGPDSEACAMFRDLLEMVDDSALRAAAAQVGCI
jgi:hypothetical protein